MALNFPASPYQGQIVDFNGLRWQWSGSQWRRLSNAEFKRLIDTPDAYTGQSGKSVVVKTNEEGVEFTDDEEGGSGDDGWSPVFAVVTDGERRVLQVTDWVGGEGTKPAIDKYVGTTGLVDSVGDGVDIRGATGAAGEDGQDGDDGQDGAGLSGGNWKVFYTDGDGDLQELALGADGTYLKSNGATSAPSFDTPAGGGSSIFPGAFAGLKLSNNTTDADYDIDIAAGAAAAADFSDVMVLNSAITKRLDAAWSVGSGNGGLDSGTMAADSWYAVWLIKRSDTGVVDALFSLSATAPTMPTNYDKKRLIGWINTTSGGVIRQFFQAAGWTMWREPTLDYNVTNLGATRVLVPLTVPPVDCEVKLFGTSTHATTNNALVWVGPPGITDAEPSAAASPGSLVRNYASNTAVPFTVSTIAQNAEVAARALNSNTLLRLFLQGYKFTP